METYNRFDSTESYRGLPKSQQREKSHTSAAGGRGRRGDEGESIGRLFAEVHSHLNNGNLSHKHIPLVLVLDSAKLYNLASVFCSRDLMLHLVNCRGATLFPLNVSTGGEGAEAESTAIW